MEPYDIYETSRRGTEAQFAVEMRVINAEVVIGSEAIFCFNFFQESNTTHSIKQSFLNS